MSNSGFVDFIPAGKDQKQGISTDGSLFKDFVPETKLENIPVKKEKPVVVLSDADIETAKAMEAETIAENVGVETAVSVEIPVEPEVEIGQPPEGGNGESPIEVTLAADETPILTEQEQISKAEPHVKNQKSAQRKVGRR